MNKIFISVIVLVLLLTVIVYVGSIQYSTIENDWTVDKNEYPKDEYRLDDLPVSHKSAYEIRQFFEDSDADHDGVLKNNEINDFDYKVKHSQFTFNGPYGYT